MVASSEAFATACGTTPQLWEGTSSSPAFSATDLRQSAPVTAVTFGSGGVLFSGDAAGLISLHHAGRSGTGSEQVALNPGTDATDATWQINSLAVTTGAETARLAVGCKRGTVQLWSLLERVRLYPAWCQRNLRARRSARHELRQSSKRAVGGQPSV